MTNAQAATITALEANYGEATSHQPTEGRFDHSRIVVQFALGASVIVNANGTYIG
jgi:hypothetical protein